MQRHNWASAIVWCCVANLSPCVGIVDRVQAEETERLQSAKSAVQEFAIGKDGRVIILPVSLDGSDIACLMDTGACCSSFDISLKSSLGPPRGTQILTTPAGRIRVKTFGWPKANLGNRPLESDVPVVCLDFEEIRRATNAEIYGVIGMDVLRHKCVQIDFDRGILRLLETIPEHPEQLGDKLPIEFSDDGTAQLAGSPGHATIERFLIDTGTQGQSLAKDVFDTLREQKQLHLRGSFTSITVGGEVQGNRGLLDDFSIGPFTHHALRFSRVSPSSVGLRYLSRFHVTFDFPRCCAYLRPAAQFEKAEPCATSGISVLWQDGEAVVHSVRQAGPAAAQGLEEGDVLLTVAGQEVTGFDPFSLRQLLTSSAGRKVPIDIRRGDRRFHIELVLQED